MQIASRDSAEVAPLCYLTLSPAVISHSCGRAVCAEPYGVPVSRCDSHQFVPRINIACSSLRLPVARAVPSARTASVRRHPAAMLTTLVQSSMSHCPSLFQPTARTVPFAHNPTVCALPVLEAVWTFPTATATTPVHPRTQGSSPVEMPAVSTEPSDVTPTECRRPAAIAERKSSLATCRSSQELRRGTSVPR
jgi:hypothetical protein